MTVRTQNNNYWSKRSLERIVKAEKESLPYIRQVKSIYKNSAKETVNQVKKLYSAYYKNDGTFDLEALEKIANKGDIKRFLADMKKAGLSTYLPKNYRGRMTREELLNAQIWGNIKKMAIKENAITSESYQNTYENTYYRTIYDTSKGINENISFATLDQRTIDDILSTKFYGENYSQRIWHNTDKLANNLQSIIGQAIINGESNQKLARRIMQEYGTQGKKKGAYYDAYRLARTETNYFQNKSSIDAYKEMGFEKYKFLATLDNRTSQICREHDGKIYKLKDAVQGENAPPLHPNCRSGVSPYIGKEYEPETRIAKDENGNYYTIKNMNYKEWFDTYVNKQEPAQEKQNKPIKKETKEPTYKYKLSNNISSELQEIYKERFEELADLFPKVKESHKKSGILVESNGRPTRTAAYFQHTYSGNPIKFSISTRYKTIKEVEAITERNVLAGWWSKASKDNLKNLVITHEFGHAVENYILKEKNYIGYRYSLGADLIRSEITNIAKNNNPAFVTSNNLSRYGRKNSQEFFAETFANAFCGEPNELGKAMLEYLKKENIYNGK